MKRIVCDTNIYISSFLFPKSKPAIVIELSRMNLVEMYISPFIIGEIQKILRDKFTLSKRDIETSLKAIIKHSHLVDPGEHISIIQEKQDDNRILECALHANADYLITGDKKHILPLKEYRGIKICTPADFLEMKLWY